MNIINLKTRKQIYTEQQKQARNKKEKKEQKTAQMPQQQAIQILQWSALEFIKHEKTPVWFIFGGIIAIVLIIIALWTKNFIFALIIILATFSVFIWAQKQPKKITFSLTPRGLKIQDTVYTFDNLKSFWIFYEPPEIKYLSIESKKLFMPRIVIPIDDENPNEIRKYLLKYLPEEEQHESLIDILARRLKY